MAAAAREAGVPVVTGDTKVVERGKGDGVFITTTGVGVVADGVDISGDRARPGDRILRQRHASATTAWRSCRCARTWRSRRRSASDTAALHGLVAAMVAAAPDIHCLRDPTRGGLATTLNEIARPVGLRHGDRTRSRDPGAAGRSPPPASSSASIRCTSPTRAS